MANYLTQQDVQDYGTELIDVVQRGALHAVAPQLQNLEQQNIELQRRLARESRARLDAVVEQAVPNYREIDNTPHWHRYLLTVDPLSGRVRQTLLNDAIASGTTHRVISFFRQFLQGGPRGRARPGRGHPHQASPSIPVPTSNSSSRTAKVPMPVEKLNGPGRKPTSSRPVAKAGCSGDVGGK
jgi:hypothetical protein